MKTLHFSKLRLIVTPLLALLAARVLAQSDLPPVPPGAYYSDDGALVAGGGN